MNKNIPPKVSRLNFRKVKLPFHRNSVHFFFQALRFFRSISNCYARNFTIVIIKMVGIFIVLFIRDLARKLVNGIGKDCSQIVVDVLNVMTIC